MLFRNEPVIKTSTKIVLLAESLQCLHTRLDYLVPSGEMMSSLETVGALHTTLGTVLHNIRIVETPHIAVLIG